MNFPDLPHLKQLQKDLWRWPQSRAAVMVGAGLSLNAEPLPGVTTRFPTWRQLVRAMFDELHPPQPGETPEQIQARDVRFNSAAALRIASEYEAAFDRRKLDLLIRTQNPDADHQPGLLHKLLLRLPWADVFTTNYDTLLERTEIAGRTYQPVTKSTELTTAFAPRIVKLHGSFPSQTPFIITDEDYRTYPRQFAPLVNSVQQSLLENSFVLIGFSGDDPNFLAWTGWIRDELGGEHASIYLVGALSLENAERSVLARRGVTPIDLSPLFAGFVPPNGLHAASLEWFLQSLAAARPSRPESWPTLDQGTGTSRNFKPPLILEDKAAPDTVSLSPDIRVPLTAEIVDKVIARWQFERLSYPGWIVAEEGKRSNLWTTTKYWIAPLANFAKDWPPADRILLFREINWRLETSMIPLFTEWINSFEKALNEIFDTVVQGRLGELSPGIVPTTKQPTSEVVAGWLELAFGLLREARETYNADRWLALKAQIDQVLPQRPQQADRNHYEGALWAIWNVERGRAKELLDHWQPSGRSPQAGMWKAGLLAELDELGESRTILRAALSDIRKALRSQGKSIELLSLEGWCMYLLSSVETSLDFARYASVRMEFWERWQELKAWDCDPWAKKEYFDRVLSSSAPKPHKISEEVRGFDPGQASVTHHYADDLIGRYLPGFACIRLYEQVGIPLRLRRLNLCGDNLKNACRWIAPFIGFWSPALLIRAGKVDDLTKDDFLLRTTVAAMEASLAKRLYLWCLEILERELAAFTGSFFMDSAQESLFEVLPEVLSRLAFKMDSDYLRRTFLLALRFHSLPAVRRHIRLHQTSEPWFRRLFEAAEADLLLEWLPALITAPLFDESVSSPFPPEHVWPDPMKHFPTGRARNAKDLQVVFIAKIKEATDWLIRKVASESSEGRHRAIMRLIDVYHVKMMTPDQEQQLGGLLWSQKGANNLPDLPNFAVFGFLHVPAPAGTDVHASIKNYILGLPLQFGAVRDAQGHASIIGPWREQSLIFDTALASKPVMQLAGEALGGVEWTPEESKQLYERARAWWENDREVLATAKKGDTFGSFGSGPILNTLRMVETFLARAILPQMEWAGEEQWQQLMGWLRELRELGVFPTIALPYVLIKRPSEAAAITEIIAADLKSDIDDAVTAAAKATRHWVLLSDIGGFPAPSPSLMATLIERVIFRRKPGIVSCLREMTYLIIEKPEAISPSQIGLLSASLMPWHHATILPMPDEQTGDFHEAERPELRVFLARLAGALDVWNGKITPLVPAPDNLAFWRDMCAGDPLPEIRRAFNAWNQPEP